MVFRILNMQNYYRTIFIIFLINYLLPFENTINKKIIFYRALIREKKKSHTRPRFENFFFNLKRPDEWRPGEKDQKKTARQKNVCTCSIRSSKAKESEAAVEARE